MREPAVLMRDEGSRLAVWLKDTATAYLTPAQARSLAVKMLNWAENARRPRSPGDSGRDGGRDHGRGAEGVERGGVWSRKRTGGGR